MSEATLPRGSTPAAAGVPWGALIPLFGLCLRQLARGKRLLILIALCLIPVALAVVGRVYAPRDGAEHMTFAIVVNIIPHALVPLIALLFATGMIQDEVEDQTLTYLLVRPLPRPAIYLIKLLGAVLVSVVLTAGSVTLTYLVIYWGNDKLAGDVLTRRVPITVAILGLAAATYCSVFGCLSLLVKRILVVGVVYIALLEGVLASIDFVLRKGTVVYYERVLALRWLALDNHSRRAWEIKLEQAPSAAECVETLAVVILVVALIAARVFAMREFRVKTPEGG
jgi:ABC-2 type transport system permease protein